MLNQSLESVNMHEAKTNFSRIVEDVKRFWKADHHRKIR